MSAASDAYTKSVERAKRYKIIQFWNDFAELIKNFATTNHWINYLLDTHAMSNHEQPPPYSQPGYTPAQYYQPPPPQMAPPPQSHTVIIQTTRPSLVPISGSPSRITCPSCHAQVLTTVKHQATTRTHCWALILCLILWVLSTINHNKNPK